MILKILYGIFKKNEFLLNHSSFFVIDGKMMVGIAGENA